MYGWILIRLISVTFISSISVHCLSATCAIDNNLLYESHLVQKTEVSYSIYRIAIQSTLLKIKFQDFFQFTTDKV